MQCSCMRTKGAGRLPWRLPMCSTLPARTGMTGIHAGNVLHATKCQSSSILTFISFSLSVPGPRLHSLPGLHQSRTFPSGGHLLSGILIFSKASFMRPWGQRTNQAISRWRKPNTYWRSFHSPQWKVGTNACWSGCRRR